MSQELDALDERTVATVLVCNPLPSYRDGTHHTVPGEAGQSALSWREPFGRLIAALRRQGYDIVKVPR